MRSLFIVSAHSGYGGAERSIEVIVNRLQGDVRFAKVRQLYSAEQVIPQLRAVLNV